MTTGAPDPTNRDRTPLLDYRSPAPPDFKRPRVGALYDTISVPSDPELRRWWARRLSFRAALIVLFCAIAFYFGPNEINFGKLTRPSPSDFVHQVETECVPVVRAMKEYQRDCGRFPEKIEDLVPRYLTPTQSAGFQGYVYHGQFACWSKWNELIEYEFKPGAERWTVRGGFFSGTIPVPPVTLGPPPQPNQ